MKYQQLDLFTDYEKEFQKQQQVKIEQKKERSLQKARLEIQKKYGKNAILRGMNLLEGAMTRERSPDWRSQRVKVNVQEYADIIEMQHPISKSNAPVANP